MTSQAATWRIRGALVVAVSVLLLPQNTLINAVTVDTRTYVESIR